MHIGKMLHYGLFDDLIGGAVQRNTAGFAFKLLQKLVSNTISLRVQGRPIISKESVLLNQEPPQNLR